MAMFEMEASRVITLSSLQTAIHSMHSTHCRQCSDSLIEELLRRMAHERNDPLQHADHFVHNLQVGLRLCAASQIWTECLCMGNQQFGTHLNMALSL